MLVQVPRLAAGLFGGPLLPPSLYGEHLPRLQMNMFSRANKRMERKRIFHCVMRTQGRARRSGKQESFFARQESAELYVVHLFRSKLESACNCNRTTGRCVTGLSEQRVVQNGHHKSLGYSLDDYAVEEDDDQPDRVTPG